MKNSKPFSPYLVGIALICIAMTMFAACASYSKDKMQGDLQDSVYKFNKRFEGKMMDISSVFVKMDKRRGFLTDSLKVKDQIVFYDSSLLDIQLFKDDLLIKQNSSGAEEEFNKAIVTIRYQLAVLPSNKIKTILVDQEWVQEDEQWWVVPDLDVFFKQ